MNETITPQSIVNILNEALEADPVAVNMLFNNRVICNNTLADHPTIQVGAYNRDTLQPTPNGPYTFSVLGLINGFVGVDENDIGFVEAYVDEGKIIRFAIRQ